MTKSSIEFIDFAVLNLVETLVISMNCKNYLYSCRILILFVMFFWCEQAIMYILCFRMRSLMDIPRLKLQLLNMPMEAILKHKLSPLKVTNFTTIMVFINKQI